MTFHRKLTAIAATLSLSALLALAPAHAAQVSKADYKAGKNKISATYQVDKQACATLTANAKDVCHEEAKAKQKNDLAALEYAYTGKPADEKKLLKVKVDTAYDVAKEKCDDQSGNAKDVCVQQAKTNRDKGLAELKLVKEVAAAGKDATEATREADLKLANEKCDAMSGDAKNSCQAAATARFGKR